MYGGRSYYCLRRFRNITLLRSSAFVWSNDARIEVKEPHKENEWGEERKGKGNNARGGVLKTGTPESEAAKKKKSGFQKKKTPTTGVTSSAGGAARAHRFHSQIKRRVCASCRPPVRA